MSHALRHARLWQGIGVALIVVVIAGSLASITPVMPVQGGDKLHHLLAYAVLMYWWGMLQPRRLGGWALALVMLGAALEFAQSLTPSRSMEWQDAAANAAGVALALALLATPASRLVGRLDQHLADRLDARRP